MWRMFPASGRHDNAGCRKDPDDAGMNVDRVIGVGINAGDVVVEVVVVVVFVDALSSDIVLSSSTRSSRRIAAKGAISSGNTSSATFPDSSIPSSCRRPASDSVPLPVPACRFAKALFRSSNHRKASFGFSLCFPLSLSGWMSSNVLEGSPVLFSASSAAARMASSTAFSSLSNSDASVS